MTTESIYITEHFQIPMLEFEGDFKGLSDRILTYAYSLANPDTFRNHKIVVKGWDEPYLAVQSDRLETERETKLRIAKEERSKLDHEKYLIEQEARERDLYARLKEKYGDV